MQSWKEHSEKICDVDHLPIINVKIFSSLFSFIHFFVSSLPREIVRARLIDEFDDRLNDPFNLLVSGGVTSRESTLMFYNRMHRCIWSFSVPFTFSSSVFNLKILNKKEMSFYTNWIDDEIFHSNFSLYYFFFSLINILLLFWAHSVLAVGYNIEFSQQKLKLFSSSYWTFFFYLRSLHILSEGALAHG